MKKVIAILLLVVSVCTLTFACSKKEPTVIKDTDEFIVLKPTADYAGKKLIEFMDYTRSQGTLDYTSETSAYGDFINSVNGIANTNEKYWMLYTDDEENSNSAWGEISYKDKIYVSAALGASDLVIRSSCTYIWVYTATTPY